MPWIGWAMPLPGFLRRGTVSQRFHQERSTAVVVDANARTPVTVLAVDDQAVFRRTARSLIAATPGFEQVGEAASGQEALELAAELRPDLLLVDVRMPGMDGLETARRLSEIDPTAVIVLISLDPVPELPASIDSVGARAHLRKQELSTRTLRAVWDEHSSARGETQTEV